MAYKDVVREMFAKHKGKPPKEIMRMASAEWNRQKAGKGSKKAKAGSLFGDVGGLADSILGFGLEDPEGGKMKRRAPRAKKEKAGSLFGHIGGIADNLLGFGLDDPEGGKMKKRRAPRAKKEKAGSLFGHIGGIADNLLGFGIDEPQGGKMRKRRVRGGNVMDNEGMQGGGIFDNLGLGLASMFGAGMNKKMPQPNMPARNPPRKAYGGDQQLVLGKQARQSGAIAERGGGVSAGGVSGGSFLDGLGASLPFLALL
jgi:hypothetical protein